MTDEFDKLFKILIKEETPPEAPQGDAPAAEGEGSDALPDMDVDLGDEDIGAGDEDQEPVFPEEIELAKLAIAALYFNKDSKDVHKLGLWVNEVDPQTGEKHKERIPFEKITDYFESTKNYKAVLGFVEHVISYYEGFGAKWTEDPEIRGKDIIGKIREFQKLPEEEQLDKAKRIYWVRIILNCLMHGEPGYNLTVSDVNEKNIGEVYRKLKQDFGGDTRGLMPNIGLRGAGTF